MFARTKLLPVLILISVAVTVFHVQEASCQVMLPDLIISSLTNDPEIPATNETINFYVVVKNDGNTTCGASQANLLIAGEATPSEHVIPSLGPGETFQFQRTQKITASGVYSVTATADAIGNIIESDENNNTKTIILYVSKPTKPDLIVETLTHSPANPTNFDIVTITAIVRNVGADPAPTTTLAIQLGAELTPETYPIPALATGETYQVQRIEQIITGGIYPVTATADYYNVANESNEANNTNTDSITVTEVYGPDLFIDSLSYAPANPTIIDTITISAVVKNRGNEPATSSTLEISIPGELDPPQYMVPSLDVDETFLVERQVILDTQGTNVVTATADVLDEVDEVIENNNTDTVSIDVVYPDLPDLIVDTITNTPQYPVMGDTVTIEAVVKNAGWAEATTSTLNLVVDGELTSHTIPALMPDAIFAVQRDNMFPDAGTFPILAIADANDDVMEAYEDNNTKELALKIGIPGPDLIIESFTYTPLNPTIHDTIIFSADLKNIGNAQATSSTLMIQLIGEAISLTYNVPPIPSQGTFTAKRLINLTIPGFYEVKATADINNTVDEAFEDNNEAFLSLDVVLPILPDLIINKLETTQDNPNTSETFSVMVEVLNAGLLDATSSTLALFAGDEIVPYLYEIPPLDISTSYTVYQDFMYDENIGYLFTAVADSEKAILEIYEDNNMKTIEVFVGSIFNKLKNYLLGKAELTEKEGYLADANLDLKLDAADLIYLILYGKK